MHVIVVRRDLTGYQHVHPRRTADGGWAVDVAFQASGPHRFYADFVVDGRPRTLAGREIDFDVALEGGGSHRLFLQFKHDGKVRTAAFTEAPASRAPTHEEDGHGH